MHGDAVNGIDPTGLEIEPFDPDPNPLTASVKGILAHELFSEYVTRNFQIANPGSWLSVVLPQHFSTGDPGHNLKPDAVDKTGQEYFELKPISHINSLYHQEIDFSTQLQFYDTYLPPVGYHRGWSPRIVPNVAGGALIGQFSFNKKTYAVYAYPENNLVLQKSLHPGRGLIYYTLKETGGDDDRPRVPPFLFWTEVQNNTGAKFRSVRKEFMDVATQYQNQQLAAYVATSLVVGAGVYLGASIGMRVSFQAMVSSIGGVAI